MHILRVSGSWKSQNHLTVSCYCKILLKLAMSSQIITTLLVIACLRGPDELQIYARSARAGKTNVKGIRVLGNKIPNQTTPNQSWVGARM